MGPDRELDLLARLVEAKAALDLERRALATARAELAEAQRRLREHQAPVLEELRQAIAKIQPRRPRVLQLAPKPREVDGLTYVPIPLEPYLSEAA